MARYPDFHGRSLRWGFIGKSQWGGRCVTYLFGGDKNSWMGKKIPDSVNVFADDSAGGNLSLAFYLSDYYPGMLGVPF